ncbi:MAG: galactose mutarotase [Erysipelotrichaceae bacterium]|nr:galactose mutarotase [Erysipelotrichaceae bacterium]MDY6035674.1 aldose epimerase family protein [Bulleidia sp.]
MNKVEFGTDKTGETIYLYTLENHNFKVQVTDYGATLVSFVDKTTNIDIVEGYSTADIYQQETTFLGASVGRTANRIAKGKFTLNDKEYHLYINNNGNCNHGGKEGFDKKMYETKMSDDAITFMRISPDQEEGYPGNLEYSITYTLQETGLLITTKATSDQDTIFAYTNHAYFNLSQSVSVLDHTLQIPTNRYALLDETCLTRNEFQDVENTPFDFRTVKKIGKDIDENHIQLQYGNGYDHHFPIDGDGMRTMAVLSDGKLELEMASDYPGFHLYTANWLNGAIGKDGRRYLARSAVCLEAEYIPNAINYPSYKPQPIIKAHQTQIHHIAFVVRHTK